MNWDGIHVERYVLTNTILTTFERCGNNGNYQDWINWLLSAIKALRALIALSERAMRLQMKASLEESLLLKLEGRLCRNSGLRPNWKSR